MDGLLLLAAKAAAVKFAGDEGVTGVRQFETGLGVPTGGAAGKPLSLEELRALESPAASVPVSAPLPSKPFVGRSSVGNKLLSALRSRGGMRGLAGAAGTLGLGLGLGAVGRHRAAQPLPKLPPLELPPPSIPELNREPPPVAPSAPPSEPVSTRKQLQQLAAKWLKREE